MIKITLPDDFGTCTAAEILDGGDKKLDSITCSGSSPIYVTVGTALSANTWYTLKVTIPGTGATAKIYKSPVSISTVSSTDAN